jgi:integrase
VNEITQLRAEDVYEGALPDTVRNGPAPKRFWVIRITPEAGGVKSGEYRTVPLHDHLIEQGFIEFVKARGEGPLFYAPERQKAGTSGQNPTYVRVGQAIGEWVRGLGVKDPRVAPNHGWRHRFKTVARDCCMDAAKLDAIQGHAHAGVSGEYGDFWDAALKVEIDKHPRYEVSAAKSVDRRRAAVRPAQLRPGPG